VVILVDRCSTSYYSGFLMEIEMIPVVMNWFLPKECNVCVMFVTRVELSLDYVVNNPDKTTVFLLSSVCLLSSCMRLLSSKCSV
jgi:hypothetical protein